MRTRDIVCVVLVCVFGCEFTKTDIAKDLVSKLEPAKKIVAIAAVSPDVQAIVDSMSDVSKDDAAKLYTIFSGMALYIDQTTKVTNTLRTEQLILEVQKDFGYDKGKYSDFHSAVKNYLNERGWKTTRKIVSTPMTENPKEVTRTTIVSEINVLAEACKIVRDTNGK